MFNPIKNNRTTHLLNAPADIDAGAYNIAPLHVEVNAEEMYFTSYWSVPWRDRLRILFGVPVRAHVMGQYHPPIMLDAEK